MADHEYKQRGIDKKRDLLREENLTYDDYANFDDGNRYELAGGKLELMSGPSTLHQSVSFELQRKIADTCANDALIFYASIDVILSPQEVRQPDLVVIKRTRMHLLSKRGIEGPPDIVVEILSPSTAKRDKISKMKIYADHGIPEYWIVEPAGETLELYSLVDGSFKLTNVYAESEVVESQVLPCISFTMQDIMDRVPEVLR